MGAEGQPTPVHDRIQEACLAAWNGGRLDITRIGLLPEERAALEEEALHLHERSSYYGSDPRSFEQMGRGDVLVNLITGSLIEITRN